MEKFIQAIFCPPNDRYDGELNLPSRLTDETFAMLKDMRINRIFGWGWDSRETTIIKTLELCEKYDIDYFLQVKTAYEYISTPVDTRGKKPFCELTKEEIADLDKRFVAEIKKYSGYKALKGVLFEDEVGYLSFGGVLHAKEVFDKEFPSYEFHTNFLCYTINEHMFWTSFIPEQNVVPEELKPFKLEGKNAVTFENRYNYYGLFVDGLLSKSHFDFFSFDKYPFELDWKECKTFMHVCFIDSVAFLRTKKDEYGSKFYAYVGAGQWFTKSKREMTEAEFSLSMNICALYGIDGFGYFPGFYPIDFVVHSGLHHSADGEAGLIDINGKPTRYYYLLKKLNDYFAKIENDVLTSEFVGVKAYGEYYNGFTKDDVKDLPDNEVIFFGALPEFYKVEKQNIQVLSPTNCLAVSEFNNGGKRRFYVANMSTVYSNDATLKLNGSFNVHRLYGEYDIENEISIHLDPGEGLYLIEK